MQILDERERDEMAKEFVEALWAMGPVGSGLLDERERDEMAKEFVEALWAMGPVGSDDCAAWLARMLAEVGIDMPNPSIDARASQTINERKGETP